MGEGFEGLRAPICTDDQPVSMAHIADTSSLVGRNFAMRGPALERENAALSGTFLMVGLRPGLVVHTSETTDLHDMTTSVEQQPGLTIHVFLDGSADASIGGRGLGLGHRHGEAVEGVMTARARPDLFERHGRPGEHVRKVNVTMSSRWLEESAFEGVGDWRSLQSFACTHLARFAWTAGPSVISLAEQMLHPPRYSALMQNLYLESRAIDLVSETFAAFTQHTAGVEVAALKAVDRKRLTLIEEYIEAHGYASPSLDAIAQAGGVSMTTLRRLFRTAHDMTVFEYIRCRGLERARRALEREGVAVAEAAFLAGYASPANFATAFKRQFGVTPTEIRRH